MYPAETLMELTAETPVQRAQHSLVAQLSAMGCKIGASPDGNLGLSLSFIVTISLMRAATSPAPLLHPWGSMIDNISLPTRIRNDEKACRTTYSQIS